MKQELLKKYLQNRAGREQVNHLQLDDVVAEYPYFNSLHLLAAKKAKTETTDQQSHLLFNAALHACNRKNLYHFIENDTWSRTSVKELKPADNQIVEKKENSSDTEINKQAAEKKRKEKEAPKAESKKELDPHSGNATFTAWLRKLKANPEQNNKDDKKEATETKTDDHTSVGELDEQFKANSYEAELLQSAAKLESISGKKSDIPETEEKSKDYEKLLSKQAEKSDNFENEGYTETLANIFVAQKKYAKAIEAYEYLSLKYPEKSSFFAEQIQNLKNKL